MELVVNRDVFGLSAGPPPTALPSGPTSATGVNGPPAQRHRAEPVSASIGRSSSWPFSPPACSCWEASHPAVFVGALAAVIARLGSVPMEEEGGKR